MEAKDASTTLLYDDLFRENESHVGKLLWFKGKIIQVDDQADDKYLLRVNVTEDENGFWSDDVRLDYQGPRVIEDDVVEFVGEVHGIWEYTTVFGASRTIPRLKSQGLTVITD